jgi:hypothetical protein
VIPGLLERRQPTRVPVELPLVVEHAGGQFRAVARNLGLGGAFIEADQAPAYGTRVAVLIELPGTAELSSLPAVVRWQNADGFGVQFLQLGAHATYALSALTTASR